jgi:hypothetical protein
MGSKPHERRVFAALALNGVPIDVLAQRPSTTRGALYETPAEARRALQRIMDGRRSPDIPRTSCEGPQLVLALRLSQRP